MAMKAAIFDMDGTLIDSLIFWGPLWSCCGETYLGDKSFVPSAEDDKRVRTLTMKDAMQLIHDRYGIAESGEELLRFANDLIYDFYANTVKCKAGVKEFLAYCQKNGVKMCIASATARELVDVAMKHCGLEEYFSAVISCADFGKGKDAPDVFLGAAAHLGESIEDTWVFEDSAVAVETAAKIGMPVVGIYDPNNYGQNKIKELARVYIGPGETLAKLIK